PREMAECCERDELKAEVPRCRTHMQEEPRSDASVTKTRPNIHLTNVQQDETLSQTTKSTGPAEALSATHRSEAAMPARSYAGGCDAGRIARARLVKN